MRLLPDPLAEVTQATLAVIVGLILLRIVWILKDSLAWLCLALGLVAGWAAGILLAPYQSAKERFREYVKVASAFITGYGVSKLDRLFELWVDPARGALILSQAFANRVLICISSFFLAAVSTYVSRKYLSFGPESAQVRVNIEWLRGRSE